MKYFSHKKKELFGKKYLKASNHAACQRLIKASSCCQQTTKLLTIKPTNAHFSPLFHPPSAIKKHKNIVCQPFSSDQQGAIRIFAAPARLQPSQKKRSHIVLLFSNHACRLHQSWLIRLATAPCWLLYLAFSRLLYGRAAVPESISKFNAPIFILGRNASGNLPPL